MSLLYSCETGERIFEVAFTFKVSVTGVVVGSVGSLRVILPESFIFSNPGVDVMSISLL